METAEWTEQTDGLCPTCLRTVPARLFVEANRVWMERTCPRHGASKALLASDVAEYLRLRQYVAPRMGLSSAITGCCGSDSACCAPGEEKEKRRKGEKEKIQDTRYEIQAGEESRSTLNSQLSTDPVQPPITNHQPPTCVLLLEITLACNLRCPTCYADARGHDFMTVETARQRLDTFFRTQQQSGRADAQWRRTDHSSPFCRHAASRAGISHRAHSGQHERPAHWNKATNCWKPWPRIVTAWNCSSRFPVSGPMCMTRLYGKDLRRASSRRRCERAQEKGLFVTLVATTGAGRQ